MTTKQSDGAQWNLYVLTARVDPRTTLLHVPISADVHREIGALFQEGARRCNYEALTEIPYRPFYLPDEEVMSIPVAYDAKTDFSGLILPSDFGRMLRASEDIADVPANFAWSGARALVWARKARAPEKGEIYLQAFEARQSLARSRTFLFASNRFERLSDPAVVLREDIDAIIRGGKLLFVRDFYVKRFFDLSGFAMEATEEESIGFYSDKAFHGDPVLASSLGDQWCRRKITSIKSENPALTFNRSALRGLAKNFGVTLVFSSVGGVEKIVLPSNRAELKALLRLLDDDYFHSTISSKKYRSTSKRTV